MNMSKIQRLSKQHADLSKFYKVCIRNGAELTVKDSETGIPGSLLDYNTTRLIISDVRISLLASLDGIEKEIKKESARL